VKSPLLETRDVTAFMDNPNLCRAWTEFRSSVAARMHLFPDALYPEQAMLAVARWQESKAHEGYVRRGGRRAKVLDPFGQYEVWSSVRGSLIYGEVLSHLVNPATERTFCGKRQGRMTKKYTRFSPKHDCQQCVRAVEHLQAKGGKLSTPDGYDEVPRENTPED